MLRNGIPLLHCSLFCCYSIFFNKSETNERYGTSSITDVVTPRTGVLHEFLLVVTNRIGWVRIVAIGLF